MTTPKEAFAAALQLKEGEAIKIDFKDEKRMDSFRVSLYREKANRKDETILIKRKDGFLILKQGEKKESWESTASLSIVQDNDVESESEVKGETGGNKTKDFKTFDGTKAIAIKGAMASLFISEQEEINASYQEESIKISLDDSISEDEKKNLMILLINRTNVRLEELGNRRRKTIREMGII